MKTHATIAGFVISMEDVERITRYASLREREIAAGLDSPGVEDLALIRILQLFRHVGIVDDKDYIP